MEELTDEFHVPLSPSFVWAVQTDEPLVIVVLVPLLRVHQYFPHLKTSQVTIQIIVESEWSICGRRRRGRTERRGLESQLALAKYFFWWQTFFKSQSVVSESLTSSSHIFLSRAYPNCNKNANPPGFVQNIYHRTNQPCTADIPPDILNPRFAPIVRVAFVTQLLNFHNQKLILPTNNQNYQNNLTQTLTTPPTPTLCTTLWLFHSYAETLPQQKHSYHKIDKRKWKNLCDFKQAIDDALEDICCGEITVIIHINIDHTLWVLANLLQRIDNNPFMFKWTGATFQYWKNYFFEKNLKDNF